MYKIEPILHYTPVVTVTLVGDANDADYVTTVTTLTKERFDSIYPLFMEVMSFLSDNPYCDGEDDIDYDLLESVEDVIDFPVVPSSYERCHHVRIDRIVLEDIDGKQYLILKK